MLFFFDNDFYVGEVLAVLDNGQRADIAFMKRVRNKNVFVWPEVDDITDVHAKFVCMWDVSVQSANGRTWFIPNMRDIEESYKDMKSL